MGLFSGKVVGSTPRRYSLAECQAIIDGVAERYQAWSAADHPRDRRTGVFVASGTMGKVGDANGHGIDPEAAARLASGGKGGPGAKLDGKTQIDGPEAKLYDPPEAKKTQAVPPKPAPSAPPEPAKVGPPAKTGLERRRGKLQAKAAKAEAMFAAMSEPERAAHRSEKDAKAAYKTAKKEKQPASLLDSLLAAWQGLKEPANAARKAAVKRVPKAGKAAAAPAPAATAPAVPATTPAAAPASPFAGWHEQTQQDRWQRHRAGDVYAAAGSPVRYSMFSGQVHRLFGK